MEQIQELINILKETPQMALWGISIYLLWKLLTLASWVYALKKTAQLFITRYFNFKDKKNDLELNSQEQKAYNKFLEKDFITHTGNAKGQFNELISYLKNGGPYIHESQINKALNILKNKENN